MGKYLGRYSIKYSDHLWLVAYPDDIVALKLYNMPKERFINDWIEMINREFNISLNYQDTLKKLVVNRLHSATTEILQPEARANGVPR
jgi:hypothetical protein